MSEGRSDFLNFFDVNRTPVNARAPQQPPNQSAPPPSESNAFGNAQPTERQINHVKNLLENLNIEIGGFEKHATQQGLRREEVWVRFEQDRMRIEAHQEPEHRLGDHWREIVENQVPFETLHLGSTEAFDSNANLCACAGRGAQR